MLRVEDTQVSVEFSPELLNKFADMVTRYPEGKQKSALLPILHYVQAEFGWVKPAGNG
jgi:NADH-quinone oxidoreductase subunit E